MLEEKLKQEDENIDPPKKWKLIVFYKSGKTVYPKRIFETEKAAHEYYAFMTRIYEIAARNISYYLVVPTNKNE